MLKGTDIKKAADILRSGGLVAFPTETVYGLGADGFNPLAVARIFEVKKRPSFDPLILHIGSASQVDLVFRDPDNRFIRRIIEKFWPGPLTIVAEKKPAVPDIVTSGLPTVGVRMPGNQMALDLIWEAGIPVAAPSANLFGRLSPTLPQHVQKQLKGIDYLLDGGSTAVGIESTIVEIDNDKARILRPGAITIDDISNAVPGLLWIASEEGPLIKAPGQLESHYSPVKPLYIFDKLPPSVKPGSGIIYFSGAQTEVNNAEETVILSKNGCLKEAAANLFGALHDMENNPYIQRIFIEQIEEKGIGIAIMDRLKKAAYSHRH